jgi:alpha-1,3-glucosyltransferase
MAAVSTLAKLCLVVTVVAVLPGVVSLVWTSYVLGARRGSDKPPGGGRVPPTVKLLPHALFVSSMAFFLFSFQVHEKSILLPLWPLTMILADSGPGQPSADWEWSVLVNNVGLFRSVPEHFRLSVCVFLNYSACLQHVASVSSRWTRSSVRGVGAVLELLDRV